MPTPTRPKPGTLSTAIPGTTTGSAPATGPTYYFAFGSNMHLTQMATRCPNSRLVAAATLPDFRWQINERGVANVVPAAYETHSVVHGILYTVTPRDIAALDRSEGVARQFYDKTLLRVRVEPFAVDGVANKKTVVVAEKKDWGRSSRSPGSPSLSPAQMGRRQAAEMSQARPASSGSGSGRARKGNNGIGAGGLVKEVEALVYLSGRYRGEGRIREEYVERMEKAMTDAKILGVDETYLRAQLEPLVFADVPSGRPSKPQRRIIEIRPAQE